MGKAKEAVGALALEVRALEARIGRLEGFIAEQASRVLEAIEEHSAAAGEGPEYQPPAGPSDCRELGHALRCRRCGASPNEIDEIDDWPDEPS